MAPQFSQVSISQQSDGSHIVSLNGEVLNEASWRRCKVFRDIVDDCENAAQAHSSISISPDQASLWRTVAAGDTSIVDIESLCSVLKVASFLQDEGTVTSVARTIRQSMREGLLEAAKSTTKPHPLYNRWESIQPITELLIKHLNELELAACLQSMHFEDFLSEATPQALQREFLKDSLTRSGSLDLTAIPNASLWSACIANVLRGASRVPFSHLKMYAHCVAEHPEAEGSSGAEMPIPGQPYKIRRMSSMNCVYNMSSDCHGPHGQHDVHGDEQSSPDALKEHAVETRTATKRKKKSLKDSDKYGISTPAPLPLAELKSLSSITSLDLSTDGYERAQTQFHCDVLAMLPALQALTIPVLTGPFMAVHEPEHSEQQLSMSPLLEAFSGEMTQTPAEADVAVLVQALARLSSLKSLTLRLARPNEGCMMLFRALCRDHPTLPEGTSTTTFVTNLTRLQFVSFHANCAEMASPGSCGLAKSEALELMQHIAQFQQLQSLTLQMVPKRRARPDIVADIPEYLQHISSLTGLTNLYLHYDVAYKGCGVLIFQQAPSSRSVFAFLEALAKTLEPLKNLRVLRFLSDRGSTRPSEYDVHRITPEIEARLQVFREFALRLDEVFVRGFDGDTTYPFAHLFRDVKSIKSVAVVDMSLERGCRITSPQMARDLQHLQSLTELKLMLSENLPKNCLEALGPSIGALKQLRKIYIRNGFFLSESNRDGEGNLLQRLEDTISVLPHLVNLPALEDLEQHGCSGIRDTATFVHALWNSPCKRGIKASLTRLVLGPPGTLISDGVLYAHLMLQLPKLKHLELSSSLCFFVGFNAALLSLPQLESLKLQVTFSNPLTHLREDDEPPDSALSDFLLLQVYTFNSGGTTPPLPPHWAQQIKRDRINETFAQETATSWLQGFGATLCELKHLTSLDLGFIACPCKLVAKALEGEPCEHDPRWERTETDPCNSACSLGVTGSDVAAMLHSTLQKMPQLQHFRYESQFADTPEDRYLLAKGACATAVPLNELKRIAFKVKTQ